MQITVNTKKVVISKQALRKNELIVSNHQIF